MENKIYVFLLDDLNNIIEEINIRKPNTFQEFLIEIKKNLKYLNDSYKIFYYSENNNEISIENNDAYKLSKDIIFINNIENNLLNESLFEINYEILSESRQDILNEKYFCSTCDELIKKENPYFCYICQKLFHHRCLENWNEQKQKMNENLNCPICRNELPLDQWKLKLDYEDNRKNEAEIMNKLNQYKLKSNLNNNIKLINEKKIKELKDNIIKQNEIIEIKNQYIAKISLLFRKFLIKINEINSLIKEKNNINNPIKTFRIFNEYSLNKIIDLSIDDTSTIIFSKLKILENYIKKTKENKFSDNKINDNNLYKLKIPNQNGKNKLSNEIKDSKINEINESKKEINLIYYTQKEDIYNIFGEKFVENNKKNIELIINDENKTHLIDKALLKKGENIIKLIIINKINNLSYMFYNCSTLKSVKELKYLDTRDIVNTSYMFFKCSLLKNISALKNWDMSNCHDLSNMFSFCENLIDIKPLENWNVSNSFNFSGMFNGCSLLKDLKPLQKWNISNSTNFSSIFRLPSSLII